ncbi:MAG: hypothetical protein DI622_04415 [Chryseobacterium sp.]|uniref:hypothetical protein n=1 Tax=Chryseobacterium sp. TaxID=1871047 RepID=UPI000DB44800|nr:hypothetical protein [Chryseobacterium sp.]MPS63644.1 hypothetical protein [Chryseobacterium sp.]PZU24024.1 MAG: hypothetical protein DI622_04415 [Chryseobacterium sp.]
MNPRVLELLKNPKNIQPEDVHLLRGEIDAFPYIQNIRALHLYGVHLYEKENYQRELSTTAAYTTDKKILYQLINGKIQQKPKPKIQEQIVQEDKTDLEPKTAPKQQYYQNSSFPLRRENETTNDVSCDFQSAGQVATYVYVNGERNRILFEGEEDFLTEENTHTITLTPDSLNVSNNEAFEEIEEVEPETIVEEKEVESEPVKEEIQEEQEVSFHEIETLQPDIQIGSNEELEEVAAEMEVKEEDKAIEKADFTPEKIIDEDQISTEKENIQDKEELSFHGMESFLPEVKIQTSNSKEVITEISQPSFTKHEEEMRRLIEEVEKKMKEKAASEKIKEEEPENIGHEISFAETQSFEIAATQAKEELKEGNRIEELEPKAVEVEPEKGNVAEKPKEEEPIEVKSAWKPMSIESNLPDSLLSKPAEITSPKIEMPQEEIPQEEEILPKVEEASEVVNDIPEQKEELLEELKTEQETSQVTEEHKEDVPVMNVSFFSSNWTIAQPEKEVQNTEEKEDVKEEKREEALPEAPKKNLLDSNVPGFINTWQSWLKIDRTEEVEKEKTEIKAKAIESFIENNPKISQLKEESTYVVKEKNDDISHLMTETLATLYFEQKLYTKAIKAFEILIKKNPEKEEYFKDKIQEIKDFRSKN